MKYTLIGFFGGLMAGFSLFMLYPGTPSDLTKDEDASFTLGLYMGIPVGLASLVGLLTHLTLTRGY